MQTLYKIKRARMTKSFIILAEYIRDEFGPAMAKYLIELYAKRNESVQDAIAVQIAKAFESANESDLQNPIYIRQLLNSCALVTENLINPVN